MRLTGRLGSFLPLQVDLNICHIRTLMRHMGFCFLPQGEDPSAGNANFWDELFLLKVQYKTLHLLQTHDFSQLLTILITSPIEYTLVNMNNFKTLVWPVQCNEFVNDE